jgi:hypothetical protein
VLTIVALLFCDIRIRLTGDGGEEFSLCIGDESRQAAVRRLATGCTDTCGSTGAPCRSGSICKPFPHNPDAESNNHHKKNE